MKASSLIGVLMGGIFIALGATMEGSNVMAVLNVPAMLIVFGGTLGAAMGGANFTAIKNIPRMF